MNKKHKHKKQTDKDNQQIMSDEDDLVNEIDSFLIEDEELWSINIIE